MFAKTPVFASCGAGMGVVVTTHTSQSQQRQKKCAFFVDIAKREVAKIADLVAHCPKVDTLRELNAPNPLKRPNPGSIFEGRYTWV